MLKLEGNFVKRMLKGYEYDNNTGNIIFEGEFLNDARWNGKGKEFMYVYNKNRYVFEGEYINGVRIGKIKIYNNHHKLILEGDYI